MESDFSTEWNLIVDFMSDCSRNKTRLFLFRSVFQTTVHYLWRERNGRRHGDKQQTSTLLRKVIDKQIRNKISSLLGGKSKIIKNAMEMWFAST
ncbi:hypothetical protein N665_3964s0003 [Sinapis alba]|nr:hypothetical protein N665_3964s0003 [Sinapis alba]